VRRCRTYPPQPSMSSAGNKADTPSDLRRRGCLTCRPARGRGPRKVVQPEGLHVHPATAMSEQLSLSSVRANCARVRTTCIAIWKYSPAGRNRSCFPPAAARPTIRSYGPIVVACTASGLASAGRTARGIDTATMTWLSSNPPPIRSLVGRCEYAVQSRSVTNEKGWPEALAFRRTLTPIPSYFGAESFDSIAIASCTVVMNCAGKMMVEFFSIEISAIVCRVRSCSATGCCVMMSAASPSFTAA